MPTHCPFTQALLELSSLLSSKLELLPLVRAVRSAACAVMGAERCTLFLVNKARRSRSPSPLPSP